MRRNTLFLLTCITSMVLVASCRTAPPPQKVESVGIEDAKSEPVKTESATAILGAFRAEVALLRDVLGDKEEYEIEGEPGALEVVFEDFTDPAGSVSIITLGSDGTLEGIIGIDIEASDILANESQAAVPPHNAGQ